MYKNQSVINVSVGPMYQGILERLSFSILTTMPCCVFLYINSTLFFTLRSKTVFRETSRYILLQNLLVADTCQMTLSQVMYILAACRITLTYPVCGVLIMLAELTSKISPLMLAVMSLERYVAVCYPLRHVPIVTIRNTGLAIVVVWCFSFIDVLIRVLLLVSFPFEDLQSLQMKDFCSSAAMSLDPISANYGRAHTCLLFVSAGVTVIFSFIGVMVAARSASTDQASAHKARNTLLLHMVQLLLTLSSTINNPILLALSKIVKRIVVVRVQNVFYVCLFILPRCLSPLIYGIRDKAIRRVLVPNLFCRKQRTVVAMKPEE